MDTHGHATGARGNHGHPWLYPKRLWPSMVTHGIATVDHHGSAMDDHGNPWSSMAIHGTFMALSWLSMVTRGTAMIARGNPWQCHDRP